MPEEWILDLEKKWNLTRSAEESKSWEKRCIYRVPEFMRDLVKKAYTPSLASFGPYHHGSKDLKPMEPHKRRLLHRFLCVANKTLEDVVRAMGKEVKDLMKSYDGLAEPWSTNEKQFLELMILDGCFMLEILLVFTDKQSDNCDYQDPIFGRKHVMMKLCSDMLLLENQLPLRVLQILVDVGGETIGTNDVLSLFPEVQYNENGLPSNIREPALHRLDIYRSCMISTGQFVYNDNVDVNSAKELVKAGVRLQRSDTNCFKDISFTNGVLKLPHIEVDDSTKSLLLNLVAYEQIHNLANDVISYVLFMDSLINTGSDVALLRKNKIITGWLGSDTKITTLFNNLGKEVAFQARDGGLDVNMELSKHCSKWWPWLRASFYQTYFKSPWVFLSLVGAIILLGLTILQTVYTILSYYSS